MRRNDFSDRFRSWQILSVLSWLNLRKHGVLVVHHSVPPDEQIQFALLESELPSSTLTNLWATVRRNKVLVSWKLDKYVYWKPSKWLFLYESVTNSVSKRWICDSIPLFMKGWLSRDPVTRGFDGDINIRGNFWLMCDHVRFCVKNLVLIYNENSYRFLVDKEDLVQAFIQYSENPTLLLKWSHWLNFQIDINHLTL